MFCMCVVGTIPSTRPSLGCICHIAYGLRSMGYSSRCGFVGKEQSQAGANPSGRKEELIVMVFAN